MFVEGQIIPISEWGKDHFSQITFAMTYIMDKRPLGHDHMRCNNQRHPHGAHRRSTLGLTGHMWDSKYGTRISGRRVVEWHDDWDCLLDFHDHGMLDFATGCSFWNGEMWLTDLGIQLANDVARHKALGGNWGDYKPPASILQLVSEVVHKTGSVQQLELPRAA